MKILLTTHMLGCGGTDRVCVHVANGFAAAGFDTEIVIFCSGGSAEKSLLPLVLDTVRVTTLGTRTGSRGRDLLRNLPAFIGHLRQNRPDCILSTGNNMNKITTAGLRLSGLRNSRLVLKTTNPIIRPKDGLFSRHYRRWYYRRMFRIADLVLTLSEPETCHLRTAFPVAAGRFQTVANPYVTAAMLAQPLRNDASAPLILGVGRLAPQKRLDLLIRGFAAMRNTGARLVLLGEGPDRGKLEALISELGMDGRISLPGFVDDVSSWFARADIFALTSRYEGLPAVVLEAMATNCRVVATDCFPAARTLVGDADGCAILAEPCPLQLAGLLDRMLLQPRPATLRERANGYCIDQAQRSHVDAVSAILALQPA